MKVLDGILMHMHAMIYCGVKVVQKLNAKARKMKTSYST